MTCLSAIKHSQSHDDRGRVGRGLLPRAFSPTGERMEVVNTKHADLACISP